jgi:hypothetical protein
LFNEFSSISDNNGYNVFGSRIKFTNYSKIISKKTDLNMKNLFVKIDRIRKISPIRVKIAKGGGGGKIEFRKICPKSASNLLRYNFEQCLNLFGVFRSIIWFEFFWGKFPKYLYLKFIFSSA